MKRLIILHLVLMALSSMSLYAQHVEPNTASAQSQEKIYTVDLELRNKLIPFVTEAKNLIATNNYEKAIDILLQVNQSDSLMSSVYDNLFKAAILSKNVSDKILNCFLTGKRIYEEDPTMTYFVAETFRMRQNYSQAIRQYSEALKQSDVASEKSFYHADFLKGRAFCYSKLKNYNAAIADYSVCLNSKCTDATLYMNRAICYLNVGNKKNAREDFDTSLKLGNKNAQSYIDKL